jgi:DNA recombination protein RmuC
MLVTFATIAGFMLGLFIGLAVWNKAKSAYDKESGTLRIRIAALEQDHVIDADKLQWVEQAEQKMRDAFKALASDALQSNSKSLTALTKKDIQGVVDPLKKNLESLDGHVRELEKNRQGAYKSLEQQLKQVQETHAKLHETTLTLTQALRSPTVRGRWGEIQLRRVVEMAGMVKNVEFDEQVSTDLGRPDMIAHLPNGGVLPVDAKVPLNSYLDAMESSDEELRKGHLKAHAKAMRDRIRELAQKKYWDQFESSPDFVVMFVPNEACLGAAFEYDSQLLEYAIENKVLISSPVTLLALLRTVAYGWQQHQITANAMKIANEGRELYGRLETFIQRLADVGKNLKKSVDSYNRAVGSLDRRLIPAARRFEELGLSTSELNAPDEVDLVPQLATPEDGAREDDEQTLE